MGKSELKTRFIFGPIMLLAIAGIYYSDLHWTKGRFSAGMLGLLAIVGVVEYIAMFRSAAFPVARALLLPMTVLLVGSAFLFQWTNIDHELYPLVISSMALLFPLALRGLAPDGMSRGLEEMGGTMLGFLLIAWPLYMAQGIAIRHIESILFVVLVCKGGDIGGYLSGVALGKHKLIPHISPGKTIEGSMGSMILSCAISVWLSQTLLPTEYDAAGQITKPGVDVGLTGAIFIGIMLNLTTQIGDLVESLLKRRCGVKDSSNFIPAHGGVLDLVDSLLFSFPAYLLVLTILT